MAAGEFSLNLLELLDEGLPLGSFFGEFAAKRGNLFFRAGDPVLGFPDRGEFLAEIAEFTADLDDFMSGIFDFLIAIDGAGRALVALPEREILVQFLEDWVVEADILKVGESLLIFRHDDFHRSAGIDFAVNDQLVELFFEGELFVEKPGLLCFEFPKLDQGIGFGFLGSRLIGLTACHD